MLNPHSSLYNLWLSNTWFFFNVLPFRGWCVTHPGRSVSNPLSFAVKFCAQTLSDDIFLSFVLFHKASRLLFSLLTAEYYGKCLLLLPYLVSAFRMGSYFWHSFVCVCVCVCVNNKSDSNWYALCNTEHTAAQGQIIDLNSLLLMGKGQITTPNN